MSKKSNPILEQARAMHSVGLHVLPNIPEEKRPFFSDWDSYEATDSDLDSWFQRGRYALGVRDVEGLDFDNKGHPSADDLYGEWCALVEDMAPGLTNRLLLERTVSGGYHAVWACEIIAGNQKLAKRPPTPAEQAQEPKRTSVTLIETRGRGGQFQISPSPGYTLLRGDWAALPRITPAERQILLDCARALDRGDARTIYEIRGTTPQGDRPGDLYNAQGGQEALDLLLASGWTISRSSGASLYLCRPGKKRGVSATFGHVAPGVLYVFSSNASPFEEMRAYSPFAVYAVLEHSGDFKAATKVIAKRLGIAHEDAKERRQRPAVDYVTGEVIEAPAVTGRRLRDVTPRPEFSVTTATITLAELQHKEFQPERWVIENILPEGACLLAAKPKARKTWLALACGAAVALGGKALGRLGVSQGRVLYLDLEGKQQRVQKRMRAMLGVAGIQWPANFHVATKWPQGDDGLEALYQWLQIYDDTALVVIDVLGNFRRPMDKHEQPYQYDRDTVTPINEVLEQHHAAGILVHHMNKMKLVAKSGDDIMDAISGTTGLPSAVNTMWALGRSAEDPLATIFSPRGRDLENEEALVLKWDSYLNMHVIDGNAADIATTAERREILKLLADDQPRRPKEIAAELGKTVGATQQLLNKLLLEGFVDRPGYGKYALIRSAKSAEVVGSKSYSVDAVRDPMEGSITYRVWDDDQHIVVSEWDSQEKAELDKANRERG